MTNEELITELTYHASIEKRKLLSDAADAIEQLMTKCKHLEAQLPKEDAWIKFNNPNYSPFDDSGEYLYKCNKCGKVVVKATNYCPNCGARMKGEQDGNESDH